MEREYEYEFKVGGKVHRGKIKPMSKEERKRLGI